MGLEARSITFQFNRQLPILEDVDLSIGPGEIVGLTGRSGRGKSTLGRILARHLLPTSGHVTIDGQPLPSRGFNPVQFVHQTAVFAVNPRWKIGAIVGEACAPDETLQRALGIKPLWFERYPHELSGGELQRIALLRAITAATRYIVADEITSMLDPLAQADIWHALMDQAHRRDLGILAISHDLSLLEKIGGRIVAL